MKSNNSFTFLLGNYVKGQNEIITYIIILI